MLTKTVQVGDVLKLSATPTLTGVGVGPEDEDFRWDSSNIGVATPLPNASVRGPRVEVKAKNVGVATITVYCRGFQDAIFLRVLAPGAPMRDLSLAFE